MFSRQPLTSAHFQSLSGYFRLPPVTSGYFRSPPSPAKNNPDAFLTDFYDYFRFISGSLPVYIRSSSYLTKIFQMIFFWRGGEEGFPQ